MQSELKASLGNLKSCLRIRSTVRGWERGCWELRVTGSSLPAEGTSGEHWRVRTVHSVIQVSSTFILRDGVQLNLDNIQTVAVLGRVSKYIIEAKKMSSIRYLKEVNKSKICLFWPDYVI